MATSMPVYDDIRIEITGRCNLRCPACHAADRSTTEAIAKELSIEEVLAIVRQAVDLGIREFELIGGEPFLHPELPRIIDACEGAVNICTNGLFFTDKNLAMLVSRSEKIQDFCISIDGVTSHARMRPGSSYRQVLEGVMRVKETLPKARIVMQTTCTSLNMDELPDLYEAMLDEKVRPGVWGINMFWKAGRGILNYEKLRVADIERLMHVFADIIVRHRMDGRPFVLTIYNTYNSLIAESSHERYEEYLVMDQKVHPCAYHISKPCIRSDGSVEFCNSLHCVSVNIRQAGSLRAALESEVFKEFYAFTVGDLVACPACRYMLICGGGCRGEAITHLNDIRQPDPIACEMMPLVEKVIVPVLTENEQAKYRQLIRGNIPFTHCFLKQT